MITTNKLTTKGLPILMSILALFCFSCENVDQGIGVVQKQFDYPVLKSKEFNNVLQLEIVKIDSLRETTLKEVVINLNGTTEINQIESVALYFNPEQQGLLGENKVLFSETNDITPVVKLKGDFNLKEHKNIFWLSYKLKDGADISGHIGGYFEMVSTDYGKVKVKKLTNPKKLRIGIAVRKHTDDDVHTYRIPGLVTTNKGTLLAVYDVRRDSRRDLQGDIDIGISRSVDQGESWQPMRIALDMGEWGDLLQKFNGVSDASLLVDKNSENIFVAGLWMHGVINAEGNWVKGLNENSKDWNHQWKTKGSQPGFGTKETSQFLIARSTDDGKTWEKPINLTKMCKKKEWWLWAPAPGNGITMTDGTLVLPTQGRDEKGLPFSNITYSKDGGKTWKTSEPAYHNTTECSVVQLEDGSLMLNMRDNRNREEKGENNGRAIAITHDMGKTWTAHATSHGALQEPVCMASLYKHEYRVGAEKKSILFFANPNTKEGRYNITIKASLDDGETWPEKYWLLLDEGYGRGYTSITSIDDTTLGILYEGSQAEMTFQRVAIDSIIR